MRVAIIDSDVFEGHPHVGSIAGKVQITPQGFGEDPIDRLGHGTAIAAAIREKAPHAELYSLKVFSGRLAANMDMIVRALHWCREHKMDLIILSLGTATFAGTSEFFGRPDAAAAQAPDDAAQDASADSDATDEESADAK